MRFTLCSGCSRHVRADEATCPFCEAAVSTDPSRLVKIAGGLAVAATSLVLTAASLGCAYGISEPYDGGPRTDAPTTADTPGDAR